MNLLTNCDASSLFNSRCANAVAAASATSTISSRIFVRNEASRRTFSLRASAMIAAAVRFASSSFSFLSRYASSATASFKRCAWMIASARRAEASFKKVAAASRSRSASATARAISSARAAKIRFAGFQTMAVITHNRIEKATMCAKKTQKFGKNWFTMRSCCSSSGSVHAVATIATSANSPGTKAMNQRFVRIFFNALR